MTRTLRFGMQFDFRNPPQWPQPWAKFYDETIEFAAWTETLGFHDIWVSEHHTAEDGYMPSPLLTATAIARATKKARIGTAIALAPFYHPVRFAEDWAVLDILSNGRVEPGLGLGYSPDEFSGYGVELKGRGAMVSEMLQIMRGLWNGEAVTFKSQHFDLDRARIMPRPIQKHVPIWIGGSNRAALRRAAQYGDGIIGGGNMTERYPDYVAELAEAGKPASAARMIEGGFTWFIVARDPEKTLHEVAPHVLHSVSTYAQWNRTTTHKVYSNQQNLDLAGIKKSPILKVVTPERAIELISQAADAAPIEGLYGFIPPAGYPLKKLAEHVELFATKVMPHFS
jgi:alkanesulfonate monooxygenase SsuD/methylene tetrahydromethanopterin reductase-like flavin-dependent oxidoreductase (luciferase family)